MSRRQLRIVGETKRRLNDPMRPLQLLHLFPNPSPPMRSHRAILAAALKAKGMTHVKIAKAMGWRAAATAGHKLRGERDWETGELGKMAELAGMTLVMLAEQSDDLHLTKRRRTIEGAVILDALDDAKFEAAIAMLKAMAEPNIDR